MTLGQQCQLPTQETLNQYRLKISLKDSDPTFKEEKCSLRNISHFEMEGSVLYFQSYRHTFSSPSRLYTSFSPTHTRFHVWILNTFTMYRTLHQVESAGVACHLSCAQDQTQSLHSEVDSWPRAANFIVNPPLRHPNCGVFGKSR